MDWPLRFGIFLAPFHPAGQNPTLALERDLELIVRLDELGYDEAWFGEHHSAGWELIASPEVFIAVVSQRTRNIRLGTGVSTLPFHHPLILADRMVLLDHLTRGRVMFGVGPGALPSDAFMMGIEPSRQREMMEEALEAIIALLRADEPVDMVTDWFTLREARLQLRPYTHPCFEIAVAAQISPAGPRAAGRFGASLLSLGATTVRGFDLLGAHWSVLEQQAAQYEVPCDRRKWRLVGPMHIRETEQQAKADVEHGLAGWIEYFQKVAALPIAPETADHPTFVDAMNASGVAVIGTPEMAIAQIAALVEQSGGFGTYLFMGHEWADREATLASYELFAREVMPRFQGSADRTIGSRDWSAANRPGLMDTSVAAVEKAIAAHQAERELRETGRQEPRDTSQQERAAGQA